MPADLWDIGTLQKQGIWTYYVLANLLGTVLCSTLIYYVYHVVDKLASDIFIASVASGCIMMGITCGAQCLLSMLAGRFYGEDPACKAEAIVHVSSILVQFFSVTFMSIAFARFITHKQSMPIQTALRICVGIWVVCVVGTGLGSFASPIYLVSSGTFCFFQFDSFNIAGWLVPGLILALGTMIVCHIRVLLWFRRLFRQWRGSNITSSTLTMKPTSGPSMESTMGVLSSRNIERNSTSESQLNTPPSIWAQQFQWRSTLFFLVLLFGWGSAAICTLVELAWKQRASEELVTAVGVGGVSFTFMIPLVYTISSPAYKLFLTTWTSRWVCRGMGWIMMPCKGRMWYQSHWKESQTTILSQREVLQRDIRLTHTTTTNNHTTTTNNHTTIKRSTDTPRPSELYITACSIPAPVEGKVPLEVKVETSADDCLKMKAQSSLSHFVSSTLDHSTFLDVSVNSSSSHHGVDSQSSEDDSSHKIICFQHRQYGEDITVDIVLFPTS